MELNEIRLGNYIQYRDKSSLLTVDSLGSNGFSTINQDGIQYGSDDISEYNGIPLTKEWLLKFGFHLDEGVGVWFGKELSPAKYFTIWQAYGDVPHKYTRNEPSDNININYVHQLQNLYFALVGEELQLE